MSRRNSRDEYDRLCRMITRWNDRRVELFEISMPNERLEFEGVMKFFFQYQDTYGQKVATKCIRVSSTATVEDVIEVLVQKFRPDLRMLPNLSSYALYEVHSDEDERRMDSSEKPLLTMLRWSAKDIDGRFLLRNEMKIPSPFSLHSKPSSKKSPQTKKKKKSPKNERKKKPAITRTHTDSDEIESENTKGSIARSLYEHYPSSRFTRSITNPDMIKTHWANSGSKILKGPIGTIGEHDPMTSTSENTVPISMLPDMPSKSLLATQNDTAAQLVRSAVDKFGLSLDPEDFCLVQVTIPSIGSSNPHVPGDLDIHERIMNDDERPVKIHKELSNEHRLRNRSIVQFHLRRRNSFRHQVKFPSIDFSQIPNPPVPVLIDLSHTPNSTPSHNQRNFPLTNAKMEIGSHVSLLDPNGHICLTSHGIRPQHCVIEKSSNGKCILSLLDYTAHVRVNDKVITDTAELMPNAIIHLGEKEAFRFVIPMLSHTRSSSAIPGHQTSVNREHYSGLSKAFSSDDLGHSKHTRTRHTNVTDSHIRDRTVSEHTLKADGSAVGMLDQEDDGLESQEEEVTSPVASIITTRITKKRHNSAPHVRDPVLDETPESELAVLPASLSFYQCNEQQLLQSLVSDINGSVLEFKLAPAYTIYMMARHHLSSEFTPEPNRHHSLVQMLKYSCSLIKRAVKDSRNIAGALAFWLSNTSELLHFLRRDYRLYMFAHEYENTLTSIIHMAYKHFTEYMVREIGIFLSAFLSESPDADSEESHLMDRLEGEGETSQEPDVVPISHGAFAHQAGLTSLYWSAAGAKVGRKGRATLGGVLSTLSATVSLLHLCRVNNTLSILIFNLLFRYISMRLFNKLITEPKHCTKVTGQRLLRRLERLKAWADKESLKLPADDHLEIIFQAAKLLIASKKSPDDADSLHKMCSKINSLQMAALFSNFKSREGEAVVSATLEKQLITLAYNNVDQQLISEGQEVGLQEDPNLELPFLIPEHGYSCDTMRGVPVGLEEYLDAAISADLCQLIVTKDSLGCWVPPRITTSKQRESPVSTQASTQMSQTLPKPFPYNPYAALAEQESMHLNVSSNAIFGLDNINLVVVTLKKGGPEKSLGINICESKDPTKQSEVGIFIKSLSNGGPADQDGRLHPGDQILKIDNTTLAGYTKELVIKLLRNSASQVTITVATQVAQLFGLNEVLQTSPQVSRKPVKVPVSHEYVGPPPKEGSSHAMKAARRQKRNQQQIPSRIGYDSYHGPEYQPPISSPVPPPQQSATSHIEKWIQDQREIAHQQKPSGYHRMSPPPKPSSSLSSLVVPEREEPSLPMPSSSFNQKLHNAPQHERYLMTTHHGSDVSDSRRGLHSKSSYGNFNVINSASKVVDPTYSSTTSMSGVSFPKYPSPLDQLTSDSSITGNSQSRFKDIPSSLSCQPSDPDLNSSSQSYPSLMVEKLSMEVGYHTQMSSTGFSVSSVLDQLSRKGKKGELQKSELAELEVDEIQLEKQRMQLLFYQQEKERQDQEAKVPLVDRPLSGNSSLKWSPKDGTETKSLNDEIMDPEKLLQVTKLKQELESLRKLISDQKKRCRELHFTKEREEQSLVNVEARFKSQNSRHLTPFMRPEDENKWHRDQKRRLKEWESFQSNKKDELHQLEVKECEAKTKLKALEQHASEIKKQLQACEGSGKSYGLGSTHMMQELPEREWNESIGRPLRVVSTESITTGSSWISNENISKDTISIGSESNIPSSVEFHIGGAQHSPLGCRSDSSSPGPPFSTNWYHRTDLHGSAELPTLMRNPELIHNVKNPISRGSSSAYEQEERIRMLKEEHLSSLDSIPSRSAEEKALQLRQLKREARRQQESPNHQLETVESYYPPHPSRQWPHQPTSPSHFLPLKPTGSGLDTSTMDSSLSSSTPDVVPQILAPPIRSISHSRQSSGGSGVGHDTQSYTRSRQHELGSRPHSSGSSVEPQHSRFYPGYASHDYVTSMRPQSRDGILESQSAIQSHYEQGQHGGNHGYQLPERDTSSSRSNHPRKTGGPHSYSRGRPEPPPTPIGSNLALGGRYVQRQQTEL